MNLSIILSNISNKELIKNLKKNINDNDELITLHVNSVNFKFKLDDAILNAKNNNVLLINNRDSSFSKEGVLDFYRKEGTYISYLDETKEIKLKSSIKFNKKYLKNKDFECKNVVEYIRGIKKIINENDEEIKTSIIPKTVINKTKKEKKKKILLISDVKGWAWWIKSTYIKKYLSKFYDFEIVNVVGNNKQKIRNGFDLYLTFGYSYIHYIQNKSLNKRITGITAHRNNDLLKPKMKLAHATHANSVLLYNELKQMHKNVFYTPNGVNTELFYEKIPVNKDKVIFGHVGKQAKLKNQKNIIEPAIKKANVEYKPHYNDYTNKIPHSEMVDIHNQYDVYVACSDEDGTPNGMLEAASCGRPIIINKIGNAPEFIKNGYNGFIVDKNIESYVKIIKWCNENPEKVYEMGQNAKKEIERAWTWELMSKNYLYMFDKTLGIKRTESEYENPAKYHIK